MSGNNSQLRSLDTGPLHPDKRIIQLQKERYFRAKFDEKIANRDLARARLRHLPLEIAREIKRAFGL